jgi:transcriptional regulator with XRE-family HTH domain
MILTMTQIVPSDRVTSSLAEAVRSSRLARALSTSELAERSGVSRAMIGKIERGQVQPTAALLGRLSGALAITLSELIARSEAPDRQLIRAAEQPCWTDPETGYSRRALSPTRGGPIELVEVELPARAEVSYPADTYAFVHHQIYMLSGRLSLLEGDTEHELQPGDCLELGAPQRCTFANRSRQPCRYIVALARRYERAVT